MRTTQEMLQFLQTNGVGSVEAPKHVPLIEQALLPGEEVLFIFCGNQNSQGIYSQGIHAYAMTNRRFIVAQAKVAFQRGNLKGIEVYMPDQIGNISYSKGLLTATIKISFINGTGSIMVNKPPVEFIYNQLNSTLMAARNFAFSEQQKLIVETSVTGNAKYCCKCGTKLPADAAFCSHCGSAQ